VSASTWYRLDSGSLKEVGTLIEQNKIIDDEPVGLREFMGLSRATSKGGSIEIRSADAASPAMFFVPLQRPILAPPQKSRKALM
jgi:hypothetical protein